MAILATERATNLLKHAGWGVLPVGGYDDATGSGIERLALDKGSGMADLPMSTRDGHSTAGSSGTGLGAVVRGSQVADIYFAPGLGAAILARTKLMRGFACAVMRSGSFRAWRSEPPYAG